jgi:hypothetical protein
MEVGKVYKVRHDCKGKFLMKVTKLSDEWVDGILVEGQTQCLNSNNDSFKGEKITVRRSFLTILD